MILTKEQINRYMRHIIMPEISGPGQKKLLTSTAFIYGETVKDVSPLIHYLAASGIGRIFCYFENNTDYEALFYNIRDLNEDVLIDLIHQSSVEINHLIAIGNPQSIFRIFLGGYDFISRSTHPFINTENENVFMPTVIALRNQWKGILQTFDTENALNSFMGRLSDKTLSGNSDGNIFSTAFLGTLCSIEGIKLCLNLGEVHRSLLYFDILSMEFSKEKQNKINFYVEKLLNNEYDNSTFTADIQEKLSQCKVLIVGTGGLGSPVAFALATAGIRTIGLVDHDTVEISNLNRQILHSSSRIGMPKVKSAEIFLRKINPNIKIITHNTAFNKDNAVEIIKDYDIIVSGVDNFSTRYLLNDACFFMKKPMVEAGVLRFHGLNTTIIPEKGHCYRCAFPNIPNRSNVQSCAESGVLGPVPGVIGFIEAAEVIKLATGTGNLLKNKLLFFEALNLGFTLVNLDRNPACPLCGEQASIISLQEYEIACDSRNS